MTRFRTFRCQQGACHADGATKPLPAFSTPPLLLTSVPVRILLGKSNVCPIAGAIVNRSSALQQLRGQEPFLFGDHLRAPTVPQQRPTYAYPGLKGVL